MEDTGKGVNYTFAQDRFSNRTAGPFVRLLSVLAFATWLSVIPLAKIGRAGMAVSLVPLGLLFTTWLFLEWTKRTSTNKIVSKGLSVLLALSTVLVFGVIGSAFLTIPVRISNSWRYVVEKLFYLGNKGQLILGLNDLFPRHVWTVIVSIAFLALILVFLVWLVRLRIGAGRLLGYLTLVGFGVVLGLLLPSREFQISSSVQTSQFPSHVATDALGNFVVVWHSRDQDGSEWGIYARRYGVDGIPKGDEFQVNTYTPDNQFVPRVAMDRAGNFAIVWESKGQDGSGYGVYCQRYNSGGEPLGDNFQVNSTTLDGQHDPFIAMASDGKFVVVWVSDNQDGSGTGIFGQKYEASGQPLGAEFQVNTFTTGDQKQPSVASDEIGNFAVAWESEGQDGSGQGVFVRRYDADGSAIGNEFQVNTYTSNDQRDVWISMNLRGSFVVVWASDQQDGSGLGSYARQYDPAGNPMTGELQVNTYTVGDQGLPAVSVETEGGFVVVWESEGQDGSGKGVFAQRYDAHGAKSGTEFQVNIYTTNDQFNPTLVHNPTGDLIVVWNSFGQDGHTEGVYGRIYFRNSLIPD